MIARRATPADFDQIVALRWLLKTEDQPLGPELDQTRFQKAYLDHLDRSWRAGTTTHWILSRDTGVCAVMTVRQVAKETGMSGRTGAWGYLTNVFVVADCRNAGHGSRLLHEVIVWARTVPLEFLLVWPSDRSRPFYRRAGFVGSDEMMTLTLS